MKLSKKLLFIILAIALIPLGFSLLIEYVGPFWYARGSFIQYFLAGFSIVGCGLVAIYFFMLYSAYRKRLLDEMNIFVTNFLIYLRDFRDNLSNHEIFDDSLERLQNIMDEKDKLLQDKSGFILAFTTYPRTINKFSGYIDEYVQIHNNTVPRIVKNRNMFEREQLLNMTLRQVEDIAYRGYLTVKKYARRRGRGYNFNDFKLLIGADEYEQQAKNITKQKKEAKQAQSNKPPKPPKQPKQPKPPKQPKQKKGQQQPPFGQVPPVYGQQPPPNWAQQQYQPQRPAGTPPPAYGQQPPPGWAQQQYQPQRPAGTPPPHQAQDPVIKEKAKKVKPPQGSKPPDEAPPH